MLLQFFSYSCDIFSENKLVERESFLNSPFAQGFQTPRRPKGSILGLKGNLDRRSKEYLNKITISIQMQNP